jgi:hypothetical protein
MITHHLDPEHRILHLQPHSSLEIADFEQLAAVVDPFLAESGDLAGLIVETPHFSGWDSFGAMSAHLRFVRDHHRHIKKIAIVTHSKLGDVAEHLASHFVSAEILHFPAGNLEPARQWISGEA